MYWLEISPRQYWGVNWRIPSWRSILWLHLANLKHWELHQSHYPIFFFHPLLNCCSLFNTYRTSFHLHASHVALFMISRQRSSCSMPVPQETCGKRCVSLFRWLAKRFREERAPSVAYILKKTTHGQSGPSKQQFLHNDLLQWAWKLPQLAAFITHQPQQTVFCFIFSSLAFSRCVKAQFSQPISGQSGPWLTNQSSGDSKTVGTYFEFEVILKCECRKIKLNSYDCALSHSWMFSGTIRNLEEQLQNRQNLALFFFQTFS